MMLQTIHPEDVKSALRKAFGSVFEFERRHDLPKKSVSDVLRGRPNKRVSNLLEAFLSVKADSSADKSDVSADDTHAHRQNSEAE